MNTRTLRSVLRLATSATAAGLGFTAHAETLEDRVRSADIVFRGQVISVENRFSEPDAGHPSPIPHTFVTYRIDEVLKGATQDRTLTLRFRGGPMGRDQVLLEAHSPLFDRGDRDLLLVKDNGRSSCPLVDCSEGRFRFVQGMLVDEEGMRVQIRPDGQLAPGPVMDLEEVNVTQFSDELRVSRVRVVDPDTPVLDVEPPRPAPLDPALDPSPERFTSHVRQAIARAHTPAELELARAHPAVSADIGYPFHVWGGPIDPTESSAATEPVIDGAARTPVDVGPADVLPAIPAPPTAGPSRPRSAQAPTSWLGVGFALGLAGAGALSLARVVRRRRLG